MTNNTAANIFFDSHGNPWEAVPSDHPDAIHFGPLMWAVRVHGLTYAEALALGRVYRDKEGWDWLMDLPHAPNEEGM